MCILAMPVSRPQNTTRTPTSCPQQTQTTFLFFNGCQEPFRLTPPTSGTYHVNVNDIFKAR